MFSPQSRALFLTGRFLVIKACARRNAAFLISFLKTWSAGEVVFLIQIFEAPVDTNHLVPFARKLLYICSTASNEYVVFYRPQGLSAALRTFMVSVIPDLQYREMHSAPDPSWFIQEWSQSEFRCDQLNQPAEAVRREVGCHRIVSCTTYRAQCCFSFGLRSAAQRATAIKQHSNGAGVLCEVP